MSLGSSAAEERERGEILMPLLGRACRFLLVAGASACMVQVAAATDLNVFTITSPQPQSTEWSSNFYFKANPGDASGFSWMNPTTSSALSSLGAAAGPTNESFGYNFQSGNLVLGLEGSLSAANFDGRFTSPNIPAVGAWTPNMNWLGTVTGRVGFSFGQWLPYVKGGFAAADVGSPLQGGPMGGFSQSSVPQTGWIAGVGFEYQLSPKWSLGLEYLYSDLSSGSGGQNAIGAGGSPEMYSTAVKSQSLLGRLNYKAGW